jgi:hypothetical protein
MPKLFFLTTKTEICPVLVVNQVIISANERFLNLSAFFTLWASQYCWVGRVGLDS